MINLGARCIAFHKAIILLTCLSVLVVLPAFGDLLDYSSAARSSDRASKKLIAQLANGGRAPVQSAPDAHSSPASNRGAAPVKDATTRRRRRRRHHFRHSVKRQIGAHNKSAQSRWPANHSDGQRSDSVQLNYLCRSPSNLAADQPSSVHALINDDQVGIDILHQLFDSSAGLVPKVVYSGNKHAALA